MKTLSLGRLVLVFAVFVLSIPAHAESIVSIDAPLLERRWTNEEAGELAWSNGPLGLELVRQAVLISARDELGLRTYDPVLGEPFKAEGVTALSLEMKMVELEGTQIVLSGADGLVWEADVPIKWFRGYKVVAALKAYEGLIATDIADALRAAGLEGSANTWHGSAAVPDEIGDLLAQQSLTAQFRAARLLHRLIRDEGESPERLWALSRAYANLGQECRWYIRCQHATFFARSLLYAQRLKQRVPDNPLADIAMSYAWSMAGFPGHSSPHLKPLIEQLEEIDTEGGDRPVWAGWAEFLWAALYYDYPALEEIINQHDERQHAAMMWKVIGCEFSDMDSQVFPTLDQAERITPYSLRCSVYGGFEQMGVRTGHQLTSAVFERFGKVAARELGQINDAPDAIGAEIRLLPRRELSLNNAAHISRSMVKLANAGGDDQELSYAVLGTLIGEANALHVLIRAKFMRSQWGVDASDFLDGALPAVAEHPYHPLIACFKYRANSTDPEAIALARQFHPTYLNCFVNSIFTFHLDNSIVFPNGWSREDLWSQVLQMHMGSGPGMLSHYVFRYPDPAGRSRHAQRFWREDPHHPRRITERIAYGSGFLKPEKVESLAERYSQHASVVHALAIYYQELGDLDQAHAYAERAAEMAPERKTMDRLARIELALGNEDSWLSVMQAAKELPDYGLDHSSMNRTIAHTYMNDGRYQDAIDYAVEATRSGSAWAWKCAMFAHAGLGEYDKAEEYARKIDRRYSDAHWNWAAWVFWSGHGDKNAAIKLFREHYAEDKEASPSLIAIRECWLLVSAGRFEQALQVVVEREKTGEITTRELINGVCLAHQAADDELRDRLLTQLIDFPPVEGERLRFSILGEMIKEYFGGKPFDSEALDAWHDQYDQDYGAQGYFYVGWLCMASGEHELGLKYLLPFARDPDFKESFTQESRSILRYEGIPNDQMRPTGFPYAHAWPDDR